MQAEFSESQESLNTSDWESDDKNIFEEEKKEDEERRIALFDWDNTLFCTDYFDILKLDYKELFSEKKSIEEVAAYLIHELRNLEEKILILFSELLEKGIDLFIVTNADEKWVRNCMKHFLPELSEFIEESDIKIYSAKKLFSKACPLEKWKTKCFKKVILDNYTNKKATLKILAIGDSAEEKLAALALKGLN